MSQWLIAGMDQAGIEHATLIGHSLGSLVALETASKIQARTTGVVLLGTACPMPVSEPLLSAARENSQAAIDMILLFAHAYSSQLGGNPVAGLSILNSNRRLLEISLEGVLFSDLNACNEYQRGLAAAAEIQAAITLILGREDRMTPPAAVKPLLESVKDIKIEMIEKCGHMMMSERPEQVHRALVSAVTG